MARRFLVPMVLYPGGAPPFSAPTWAPDYLDEFPTLRYASSGNARDFMLLEVTEGDPAEIDSLAGKPDVVELTESGDVRSADRSQVQTMCQEAGIADSQDFSTLRTRILQKQAAETPTSRNTNRDAIEARLRQRGRWRGGSRSALDVQRGQRG